MQTLRQLLQELHTAIYPQNMTCKLCHLEVFDGRAFCDDCRANLPYNTVYCPKCGRNIVRHGLCLDCKTQIPAFDKARSLFVYKGKARQLVLSLKNGQPHLAKAFALESKPLVKREFFDVDLVTFVPMTTKAKRERGYNQAELLAEEIAKNLGMGVTCLLEKTEDTHEQKSLNKTERLKNLHGSFKVNDHKKVKGKTILLVDDAMTTGATVEEICRILNAAGANRVYVFTIASVYYEQNEIVLSNHHKATLKPL